MNPKKKKKRVCAKKGWSQEKCANKNADEARIRLLLSEIAGRDITEVIAAGRQKLALVPSGGGVAVPAAAAATGGAAAPAAAAEAKKEEKVEEKEESEDDASIFYHYRLSS
ncbi:hypothetical protein TIFTF001_008626 [Ficus carica]|uniref:60S acidic ribosomal protein P2 n=1 Tax=Ficus carica TaxID=3494 RepID=A0AA88D307_FICCA|nr:hypothetical protein TIFTF001_008626 [Ficus carica]